VLVLAHKLDIDLTKAFQTKVDEEPRGQRGEGGRLTTLRGSEPRLLALGS